MARFLLVGMRNRVFHQLYQSDEQLSISNRFIIFCILISLGAVILGSVPAIAQQYGDWLYGMEILLTGIFTLEYGARVWSIVERKGSDGWRGRVRYMLRWTSLLDLLAIMPVYLHLGIENSMILRLLRMIRILRLARALYMAHALDDLWQVMVKRAYLLKATALLAFTVLMISATTLHLIEGNVQPEVFGTLPDALWWSVISLTTIGYGDVVPITWPGKIAAGFTAFFGIALVALPTGILASALTEIVEKRHKGKEDQREQPDAE